MISLEHTRVQISESAEVGTALTGLFLICANFSAIVSGLSLCALRANAHDGGQKSHDVSAQLQINLESSLRGQVSRDPLTEQFPPASPDSC